MSRTLGSILTIAGTAALIASGVGAAVGAVAFGSFAGATSIAGISTAALLTASTALTAVGGLLTSLGTKAPKAEISTSAIKTERPPRFSGYGRYKTFGAYCLYETASDGTAVDVWAFHEGRVDAIEGYYLGDKPATIGPDGFVLPGEDGIFGTNTIQIGANLGAATETAHAAVVAKLPSIWTPDHRGDGVASGFMLSRPVKAKSYQEVYPSGGPNATPLALVLRAQPVFDWRDPAQSVTDPLSWQWSENAVLHLAHYQLVRNGKVWARHFAPTLAYWTAAADDADVAMDLRDGGTEPRYRSCVSHRHAGDGSEHKAVIAALLACGDGWMAPRQDGALVVYSGRYYAPTVSIGPDQIVSYTIEDGIEDENAVNQIGVTYVSAAHDFNTVDTDSWTDEDDILARSAVRPDDLANQVPSHAQARRLAKRKMSQAMAPKRGSFTTLASGAAVLSERFINLLLAEGVGTADAFVAYAGPAEITGLSRNLQTGVVTASWIAADPEIDAWNPETEEGDPAPAGERVAREPLDTPMIISASAVYSAVGQNPDDPLGDSSQSTGARVLIAANGPDRADLTWYARWRVGTSGGWNEREYADADPGPAVSFTSEFVPIASNVNVQVAYVVGDGRQSPWSASSVVNTTTG